MNEWSPEAVDMLRKLRKTPMSLLEIAQELTKAGFPTTRGSVAGKCARLKIPLSPENTGVFAVKHLMKNPPKKQKVSNSTPLKTDTRKYNLGATCALIEKKSIPLEPLKDPTFIPKNPISIMELTSRTCRYPIGDTKTYCGEHIHESTPYCPDHAALCHRPVTSKDRDGARVTARHLS